MKKAQTFTIEELPRQFPEELYAAASFTFQFQYLESLNLIYIKPKPLQKQPISFFNVRRRFDYFQKAQHL